MRCLGWKRQARGGAFIGAIYPGRVVQISTARHLEWPCGNEVVASAQSGGQAGCLERSFAVATARVGESRERDPLRWTRASLRSPGAVGAGRWTEQRYAARGFLLLRR